MNQIDPVYVIKLIEASKLLSEAQKAQMKSKLDTLEASKLGGLVVALEKEQAVLTDYYKNIAHVRKIEAEKKIKIYYHHAERSIERQEESIIDDIEAELADV